MDEDTEAIGPTQLTEGCKVSAPALPYQHIFLKNRADSSLPKSIVILQYLKITVWGKKIREDRLSYLRV